LIRVSYAGAPADLEDASARTMMQSVLAALTAAIEPFAARMREFGGYVAAEIPSGFAEVKLKVHDLPPDLADEVLSRCNAMLAGE
jgi:hypothetical protein